MQANRSLFITLLFSAIFLFSSCEDKDEDQDQSQNSEHQAINKWIYEEMSEKYYWSEQMPGLSKLDFNEKPQNFFFDILYKFKKSDGDRFSNLENGDNPYYAREDAKANTISKAVHNEIGFEFQPFIDSRGVIEFLVTYIKRGTEAEKQGLVRGDWITAVDGVTMNEANWAKMLFTGKSSYKLTLANKEPLTLQTTAIHNENPIHTYKIIPDTRIGYILYNSFANGKDENSYEYAIEMNNDVLKAFEGNIDELVLDLRYNGGGLVQSGTYIASAIAPNRSGKIYTRRNYNSMLEKIASYKSTKNNYFYNEITANGTKYTIPQLKLKRLYVITSQYTASASEQIINGLRAYMTVEVIGETTTGKNMESFAIKKANDENNKWILHPLTSVTYRSNLEANDNDYSQGFPPTIGWEGMDRTGKYGFNLENDEFQTLREEGKFYDLGNPNEVLLARALEHITGKKQIRSAKMATKSNLLSVVPIGSSLDRKSSAMIIENPEQK